MKLIQTIGKSVAVGVIAILGCAVFGTSGQAYARDGSDSTTEKTYSYTAQAGDAYTQLVRKAVQTYGIVHDKDIGNARIVAIETTASEQAGWPVITQGQVVSFDESLVKSWVDNAMKLSATDVAAWQTYVPYINFDTRSIGE